MKIDLEFVELHSPLFINGTNFGLKLYADPKKAKAPITLWYDTDLRHTVVVFKDKVALIENTASMTLANPTQIGFSVNTKQVDQKIAMLSQPNHMILDGNSLLAGFAASSLGLGFFMYGKKQGRAPQMLFGVICMVYPYFVASPGWIFAILAVLVALMWLSLRLGW